MMISKELKTSRSILMLVLRFSLPLSCLLQVYAISSTVLITGPANYFVTGAPVSGRFMLAACVVVISIFLYNTKPEVAPSEPANEAVPLLPQCSSSGSLKLDYSSKQPMRWSSMHQQESG